MVNQKKTVRFDHFRPYYLTQDEDGASSEHLYQLNGLLSHVKKVAENDSFYATGKKIMGDTHMFHICRHDEHLNIWELQILHLREKVLPGIADDTGAYELIKLADNQFPAESTTVLYDAKDCILYMQRNLYGTSIKALEEYLQLLSPEGTSVLLKPIVSGTRIGKITPSARYRKLALVVDSDKLTDKQKKQSLGKVISDFNRFQGRYVKIELGFGHQRGGLLNSNEISTLTKEAYDFSGTHNLSVVMSEEEDTPFETIDLMDDRSSYKLDIEYSRNNPITHERLFRMCLGEYQQSH